MPLRAPNDPVTIKMASALVHADEALGDNGEPVDVDTFRDLLAAPDVAEYMAYLGSLALLPVKRDGS